MSIKFASLGLGNNTIKFDVFRVWSSGYKVLAWREFQESLQTGRALTSLSGTGADVIEIGKICQF
jgi:hypothetical protein